MKSNSFLRLVLISSSLLVVRAALAGNQPPQAPAILKPPAARPVNPTNFLVESGPFSDPNPGDIHRQTDWEIWDAAQSERVWSLSGAVGVERIRAYLSDGVFAGSHTGRRALFPETTYSFRLRHRDSSGDPATEFSAWTRRNFTTSSAQTFFPLEVADVLTSPNPALSTAGAGYTLPGGTPPARLRLQSAAGTLLLEIEGSVQDNPPQLEDVVAVQVVITAGSAALASPPIDLSFQSGDGEARVIYLPALTLAAGTSARF